MQHGSTEVDGVSLVEADSITAEADCTPAVPYIGGWISHVRSCLDIGKYKEKPLQELACNASTAERRFIRAQLFCPSHPVRLTAYSIME